MTKEKRFANEKLDYSKSKTQLSDPFDIKLKEHFIDAIFCLPHP